MARAGIDLGEQLASLVCQGIDGAGQAAKFAAALVVDAPGHVTRSHDPAPRSMSCSGRWILRAVV